MAQTLQSWAANSLTSGSVKVTDSKILSANVAAIQNLSNREVVGLSVLGAIYELASKSGPDYRANHKQLRIDSTSFMGGFSLCSMSTAGDLSSRIRAVLDWNNGYAADNTLGTDVNALVLNMGGIRETPETTLTWEYYYLLYQLAV